MDPTFIGIALVRTAKRGRRIHLALGGNSTVTLCGQVISGNDEVHAPDLCTCLSCLTNKDYVPIPSMVDVDPLPENSPEFYLALPAKSTEKSHYTRDGHFANCGTPVRTKNKILATDKEATCQKCAHPEVAMPGRPKASTDDKSFSESQDDFTDLLKKYS